MQNALSNYRKTTQNRIFPKSAGFSLVEMLMALLVASLLLIAMAPVVTKRFNDNVNISGTDPNAPNGDRLWVYSAEAVKMEAKVAEYDFKVPNGVWNINMLMESAGGGGAGGTNGQEINKRSIQNNAASASAASTEIPIVEGMKNLKINFMTGGGGGGGGASIATASGTSEGDTTIFKTNLTSESYTFPDGVVNARVQLLGGGGGGANGITTSIPGGGTNKCPNGYVLFSYCPQGYMCSYYEQYSTIKCCRGSSIGSIRPTQCPDRSFQHCNSGDMTTPTNTPTSKDDYGKGGSAGSYTEYNLDTEAKINAAGHTISFTAGAGGRGGAYGTNSTLSSSIEAPPTNGWETCLKLWSSPTGYGGAAGGSLTSAGGISGFGGAAGGAGGGDATGYGNGGGGGFGQYGSGGSGSNGFVKIIFGRNLINKTGGGGGASSPSISGYIIPDNILAQNIGGKIKIFAGAGGSGGTKGIWKQNANSGTDGASSIVAVFNKSGNEVYKVETFGGMKGTGAITTAQGAGGGGHSAQGGCLLNDGVSVKNIQCTTAGVSGGGGNITTGAASVGGGGGGSYYNSSFPTGAGGGGNGAASVVDGGTVNSVNNPGAGGGGGGSRGDYSYSLTGNGGNGGNGRADVSYTIEYKGTAGGGGGGGSFAKIMNITVDPGKAYKVKVGAGGSGGSPGVQGGTGGYTSLDANNGIVYRIDAGYGGAVGIAGSEANPTPVGGKAGAGGKIVNIPTKAGDTITQGKAGTNATGTSGGLGGTSGVNYKGGCGGLYNDSKICVNNSVNGGSMDSINQFIAPDLTRLVNTYGQAGAGAGGGGYEKAKGAGSGGTGQGGYVYVWWTSK